MSRNYFISSDSEQYHQSNRSQPVNITQTARATPRLQPFGTRYDRPARETEADRSQTRRRIAVACSRCRKRKIKCSGDRGTGDGCLNCKNAGTEPGECQFTRVNSNTIDCMLPEAAWPYQVSGLASAPSLMNHIGSNLSQISANNYSMPSLCSSSYPGASSFPGASSLMRGQPSATSSAFYQVGPGRTDFYSPIPLDGLYDTYPTQSTPYGLQVQEPQTSSAMYGNSESMRQWTSLGSSRSTASFDQELSGKFINTHVPYSVSDAVLPSGSVLPDSPSMFPALGGLASSLPVPNTLRSDRVLPNPRAGILLSTTDSLTGSNTGLANETTSLVTQQGTKSNVPWGTERQALEQGQTTNPRTSAGSSTGGSKSNTTTEKKSSTPPQEGQQTAFGYLEHSPLSGSPTPTTEYEGTKSNVSGTPVQNSFLSYSPYESGISGSTDSLLRRDFSSPNLYTYGSGINSKDGPQSSLSGGTLLNGQPYTRLRQPQPQPQPLMTFETSRRGSTDTRTSHRTSIASVGGSHR